MCSSSLEREEKKKTNKRKPSKDAVHCWTLFLYLLHYHIWTSSNSTVKDMNNLSWVLLGLNSRHTVCWSDSLYHLPIKLKMINTSPGERPLSVASGSFLENAVKQSILFCSLAVASLTQSWVLSVCVQVREDRERTELLLAANICKSLPRSSANVGSVI